MAMPVLVAVSIAALDIVCRGMPAGAVGVHHQARVLNLLGESLHDSREENVLAQVHETCGRERRGV